MVLKRGTETCKSSIPFVRSLLIYVITATVLYWSPTVRWYLLNSGNLRGDEAWYPSLKSRLPSLFMRFKDYKKRKNQRVVIIAGPYEARLDLARKNIAQWCKEYKLSRWAWPIPYTIEEAHKKINLTNEDGFSDLIDALSYKSWAQTDDGKVIEVCKEYLPEWGGDRVASNPRFELIIGDAYAYLADCKEKFDVIIMDISDPIEAGPGIMLYTKEFYDHAKTLLNTPNGVFVTQAGFAGQLGVEDDVCYAAIANTLKTTFDCVIPYTTYVPSFGSPWGFVMAFGCSQSTSPASIITDFTRMERDQINKIVSEKITEIEDVGKESDANNGLEVLKFYDGESHHAMFSLPKPLRLAIACDNRIMTKDNPIFMY